MTEKQPNLLTGRIVEAHRSMLETENGTPSPLRSLHVTAMQSFERLGFPAARSEAWKYTPVTKWLTEGLSFAVAPPGKSARIPEWLEHVEGYLAVSIDGVFHPELSRLPNDDASVIIMGLADALRTYPDVVTRHLGSYDMREEEAFSALNTAFVKNGLFVQIKSGSTLDKPLYVTDIPSGAVAELRQPRNLFLAESLSRATIIEWLGEPNGHPGMDNAVSEMVIGPGAHIRHCHVFDRGMNASLVNSMFVYQERDSHFTTNHIVLTGSLVRHNLNFLPDAEGCETHLRGLVATRGTMHVDIHSFVDHAKPNAFSNELYKCILDGKSTGVFNGKVMVRQDAQLINAYQSNRSVLLSDDARMYSKPELEIYADDVKCSHGATTGQLDDDAIFYLQSRGLRKEEARLLLLQSFAAEVLEEIGIEHVTDRLLERLQKLLQSSHA